MGLAVARGGLQRNDNGVSPQRGGNLLVGSEITFEVKTESQIGGDKLTGPPLCSDCKLPLDLFSGAWGIWPLAASKYT